jgi:hypothetical protein
MADFGLSAFAMFFMQSSSFLSFQRRMEEGQGRSNCQSLFGIERIPSDNYIRDILDEADPELLHPCFEQVEAHLREPRVLERFGRMGGRPMISFDGTETVNSQKIHCVHCLRRKLANGKTEYYHSLLGAIVVAPGHKRVIPLAPEFISNEDGAEKQDCERNAAKRWYQKHGERLHSLRPIYLGDDLFSCQPIVTMLTSKGDDFIFTCKPGSHKSIYDFIDGAELECCQHQKTAGKRKVKTTTYTYRWIEGVPLRDGKDAAAVNWASLVIRDAQGKVTYSSAWVTSLPINAKNIVELIDCARARWKIENEGFNVLKNHGYELEHNFGHGKTYLARTLAALNLLAFAWHTLLDTLEPRWQVARDRLAKRRSFFTDMVCLTTLILFPSWNSLIEAMATVKLSPELLSIQKNE